MRFYEHNIRNENLKLLAQYFCSKNLCKEESNMIQTNFGFNEGWSELHISELSDVTINDLHHAVLLEGVNTLGNSRSFFIFYNQTELLKKIARLVDPSQDDYIDEELFVGKSYFFQLKRNGRHLNIIDVRPLSEPSEQIQHDDKGGE